MRSFKLGEDVYLEFTVKVNNQRAFIDNVIGEVFRDDKFVCGFKTVHDVNHVWGRIENTEFKSTGNYVAKFSVFLADMGKTDHAIPFRISKSVLGKKRQ